MPQNGMRRKFALRSCGSSPAPGRTFIVDARPGNSMKQMLLIALLLVWTGVGCIDGEITVTTPIGTTHEMVLVPGGKFAMGSESGTRAEQRRRHADGMADVELEPENIVHIVFLDAFHIDKYEVTNAQFGRFVEEVGHITTVESEGRGWVYTESGWEQVSGARWNSPQGPESDLKNLLDHPVVHVSWSDARVYCASAGLRLPTEAEWEKAARGTDGRTYPWGEGIGRTRGNYGAENCCRPDDSDGSLFTSPVGSYPEGVSPYGAYDMAGNVWEWVADWYDSDYYSKSPERNPKGPSDGFYRVGRGGSWFSAPEPFLRTWFRDRIDPTFTNALLGFRCAQDVEGTAADEKTPVGVVGRFTGVDRYLIITVYEITEE